MAVPFQFATPDFSRLAQIGQNIGAMRRQQNISKILAGVPMKDGVPDFNAAYQALASGGYPDEAMKVARFAQDQFDAPDWQANPVTGQYFNRKDPTQTIGSGATNPYFRGGKETDAQARAASYGDRATAAYNAIVNAGDIENTDRDISTAAQFLPDGWLKNKLSSSNRQVFNQAADDFVNAINRRDSGYQVSEIERQRALQLYIPRPNDKPELLARKAQARRVLLEGLYASAGPNYIPQPLQEAPAAPPQVEAATPTPRKVQTSTVAPDGTVISPAQADMAGRPQSTGPMPVEPDPKKRKIGQVYFTPDGKQYLWAQDPQGNVGWEPL